MLYFWTILFDIFLFLRQLTLQFIKIRYKVHVFIKLLLILIVFLSISFTLIFFYFLNFISTFFEAHQYLFHSIGCFVLIFIFYYLLRVFFYKLFESLNVNICLSFNLVGLKSLVTCILFAYKGSKSSIFSHPTPIYEILSISLYLLFFTLNFHLKRLINCLN